VSSNLASQRLPSGAEGSRYGMDNPLPCRAHVWLAERWQHQVSRSVCWL